MKSNAGMNIERNFMLAADKKNHMGLNIVYEFERRIKTRTEYRDEFRVSSRFAGISVLDKDVACSPM